MQFHHLFALASLGLVSAAPQQSGDQQASGDANGMNMSSGMGMGGDQGDAAPGQSGGVPMDLAGGFKPDQITLQMSYSGDASQGLKSGAKVSQQDAMKEPKFALGDSSGVNTQAKWVIVIVDTTSKDQRMLHYVKSDYMASGQKTEIMSQKPPQMAYMGPGMLGEQGMGRQYTALMYTQKGDFPGMGMPEMGKPVVMTDWVKANGLDKAIAGTSFQTDVQSMGGSMMQSGGNNLMAQSDSGSGSAMTMTMSPGMPMASGESMPMPMGSDSGSGSGMEGMPAGGSPMPAGAAPTIAASASGAMPSGMMNGSIPTVAPQSPTAPAAAATSAPATGAAPSNYRWSAAVGLGAVGVFAVALF